MNRVEIGADKLIHQPYVDFSTATQKKWVPKKFPVVHFNELCGNILIGFDYQSASAASLEAQVQSFAKCMNWNGAYPEVQNLVLDLKFNWIRDFVQDMFIDKSTTDLISDLIFVPSQQPKAQNLYRLLSGTFAELKTGSIFKRFAELAGPLTKSTGSLDHPKLSKFIAELVLKESKDKVEPSVFHIFNKILLNQYETYPTFFTPTIPNYNLVIKHLTAKLIENGEMPQVQQLKQKVEDYFENIRSGTKKKAYATLAEYRAALLPIIQKFSAPSQSLTKAIFEFFDSLDGKAYTLEQVNQWLARASANVSPIEYYYPGKIPGRDKPEIILVNDLDMLELVADNADFTLNEMGQWGGSFFEDPNVNFVIQYFSRLAQAGAEMAAFVSQTNNTFEKFYNIVTFPGAGIIVKPELKRRVVNLHTVLVILGRLEKRKVNGMSDLQILRDLFLATLHSTQKTNWNNYDRGVNPLSVIVDLAKIGIFRSFGTSLWEVNNGKINNASVVPVLTILTKLSRSFEFSNTIRTLLVEDKNQKAVSTLLSSFYQVHFLKTQEIQNLKQNTSKVLNLLVQQINLEELFSVVNKFMRFKDGNSSTGFEPGKLISILASKPLALAVDEAIVLRKAITILNSDDGLIQSILHFTANFQKLSQNETQNFSNSVDEYLQNYSLEVQAFQNWISTDKRARVLMDHILVAITKQLSNGKLFELLQQISENPDKIDTDFRFLSTSKYENDFMHLLKELSTGVIDSYP